jgi:hypothetical protein
MPGSEAVNAGGGQTYPKVTFEFTSAGKLKQCIVKFLP